MSTVIFFAFYDKDNYRLLLKYADDRKVLDDKWEDWLIQLIKAKAQFDGAFELIDYPVNVEAMQEYFKRNKLKNNGGNRAKYISEQGEKEYKKTNHK